MMTHEKAIEWIESIKKGIHGGDEYYDYCRVEALEMAINALESQRWTPVTEGPPDDGTVVFYTDNKGETGMICYWEDLPWEFEDIIAWMPLPSSYQGEENG